MAKVLVKVWPQVSTINLVLDIILYVSFKDAARVRVVVLRCVLLCMEAKSRGRRLHKCWGGFFNSFLLSYMSSLPGFPFIYSFP